MWEYLLIVISAIIFGFGDLYSKKSLKREHAMQFVTAFMTFLFLLSFSFVWKVDFSIGFEDFSLIALKSALLLLAFIMLMKTLRHTEVSKTSPLRNLSIIFIILLSFIFLGEKLSFQGYLGILAVLLGTYLVEINPQLKHTFHPFSVFKNRYFIYILVYLVSISFVALIDKSILSMGVDVYTFLFFTLMFNAIFSWIIQIQFYEGEMDFEVALKKGGSWIFMGAILSLLSDVLYFTALAVPAVYLSLAVPLRRTSSLVSTIFGGNMFHEKNKIQRIIGCVVMLVGIFLILT